MISGRLGRQPVAVSGVVFSLAAATVFRIGSDSHFADRAATKSRAQRLARGLISISRRVGSLMGRATAY